MENFCIASRAHINYQRTLLHWMNYGCFDVCCASECTNEMRERERLTHYSLCTLPRVMIILHITLLQKQQPQFTWHCGCNGQSQ